MSTTGAADLIRLYFYGDQTMKRMQKIGLLAGVALAAIGVTTIAGAADLPTRKAPPAPYVPVAPPFSWTGFYVGATAGGMLLALKSGNFGGVNFFTDALDLMRGGSRRRTRLIVATRRDHGRGVKSR